MAPETISLEQRVARIFGDHLSIQVPGPEADLITSGLLDSLAIVELLYRIEQDMGVTIPVDDLDLADFRTVRSIAALLHRRGAQG
jgi:acyl carrier protein